VAGAAQHQERFGGLTQLAAAAALLLLGCGGADGCGCGAGEPTLTVSASGAMEISPGRLGKLAEGARLEVLRGDAGVVAGEIVVAGGVAAERLEAQLRCAPPGGLGAGAYALRAAPPGERLCERWGEVEDPSEPSLRLAAGMQIPAGALLQVRRPGEADQALPAVWGRLGASTGRGEPRSFEVLLPVEPPALRAGQAVDLSLTPGSDPAQLLAAEAARQARAAWLIASDEQERLGDEDDDQRTLAKLFAWADLAAERAAELSGDAAAAPGDPSQEGVWATWLTGLRQRLGRAQKETPESWQRATHLVKLHLPAATARAKGNDKRAADLESLQRLLEQAPPRPKPAPAPRPPRPKPAKRQELDYVPFAEMPSEVKEPYRHIRAIPVNPDPARFADRALEEVRQEQVTPLLRHAAAFVAATEPLAAERKAPEPRISCRVIFALDNVKRGAKVYGSTAEDIARAKQLSYQVAGRLLEQGRRECYRMMRGSAY